MFELASFRGEVENLQDNATCATSPSAPAPGEQFVRALERAAASVVYMTADLRGERTPSDAARRQLDLSAGRPEAGGEPAPRALALPPRLQSRCWRLQATA